MLLQERVNVLQGGVSPLMVRQRRARGGPAGALQHGVRCKGANASGRAGARAIMAMMIQVPECHYWQTEMICYN